MQITLEIGNHCAHDRREVSPSEGTAGGIKARVQGRKKGGQGPQEGNLNHRKPSTAQQDFRARKHQLEAPLRTGLPWFQGVRSPWELVKSHRRHILLATHTASLLLPHSLLSGSASLSPPSGPPNLTRIPAVISEWFSCLQSSSLQVHFCPAASTQSDRVQVPV